MSAGSCGSSETDPRALQRNCGVLITAGPTHCRRAEGMPDLLYVAISNVPPTWSGDDGGLGELVLSNLRPRFRTSPARSKAGEMPIVFAPIDHQVRPLNLPTCIS